MTGRSNAPVSLALAAALLAACSGAGVGDEEGAGGSAGSTERDAGGSTTASTADARGAAADAGAPTGGGGAPGSTPGASPSDPCAPEAELPGFCPGRGFYDRPVMVTLKAPDGRAAIYYTVDGTDPSPENGTRYAAPFEVAGKPGAAVAVVKAVLVTDGKPAPRVAVASYVFPETVAQQPKLPTGMPATWGTTSTTRGDYEMDPRVMELNRAAAMAALRAVPTVSIVARHEDLWSRETGIYMNPEKEGPMWERAVSVEILIPGQGGIQARSGLTLQGNSSRRGWKSPKLSLRLRFRAEYGVTKLRHPLFGEGVAKFDTLVLDAHLNNTWIHSAVDQQTKGVYVRDAFASDLARSIGGLGTRHRFVNLYLNGLYWGVYDLHERPDENFAADHLMGAEAEYDVIKHDRSMVVNGNVEAWDQMFAIARKGVADAAGLQALGGILAIDPFIDYMLLNFYLGNTDWDHQNWYAIRRRVPGAGFRFVPWDAEHVLLGVSDDVTRMNVMAGATSVGKPRELYQALRANPELLARFGKRADELLGAGGPLGAEKARALFTKRVEEFRPLVALESARWGDYRRAAQPYGLAEFDAEVKRLLEGWFPQRSQIVRQQLR